VAADAHRAIDAIWRIESARLIAGLSRMVRDISATLFPRVPPPKNAKLY
jgi:spore maturation protein SpmA